MTNPPAAPFAFSERWLRVLIFIVTLVAYLPALTGDLLWDDTGHVTRPDLQSWSGLGLIWIKPGITQQYYPLLHSAFWLEHRFWGDATLGYHLVNVLLHATAACLALKLLRQLAIPGATFAAFLFALHPVCAESVAWISEQKNTLSAVLYLSAALAYLRFAYTRRRQDHARATLWFGLALLTKTVTATLPAALLVLAWWRRGRIDRQRDVRPLLPWFVLSLGAGALTAWFEHALIGAQGSEFALSLGERALLAGRVAWFYFGKLLWPANLVFIYPRWTVDTGEAWQWLFPLAALAVLVALWRLRHKSRGPLAAALLFGGTLFPALGFVNVFPFLYSYVADHFQYLASIPIFVGVAAGASYLGRGVVLSPSVRSAIVTTIPALLATLTWCQARTYRDVFTLYADTLAKNPGAWMAHNNLAIALVDAGRAAEAIPHYEQALALRPAFAEAENNLGNALNQLGQSAQALSHLERALQLRPRYAEAQNGRAIALMSLGRTSEGIEAFAEAIKLKPDYALAHVNLGLALARNGRANEALPHFQSAVQLNPNYADAELNWGIALIVDGKIAEALPHFERAARLNPDAPEVQHGYGRALAAIGRYDDAISRFEKALELNPAFAPAHFDLGMALRQTGRTAEAESHLREARGRGAGAPPRN